MSLNKILAIAINDYDDINLNKIDNCYNDITALIGVLNEKYSFDDTELIFKKSDTTRKKLYAKLTEYFVNALPEDNILLLFAGHGEYNDRLGVSYWQPSDADPCDPSSWINVNDVLSFIKVSGALHIGIISDSCFSGAIFENRKRGGGMEAFKKRKSREALTSGGIEKVSDGKKGERSPFTEVLIKILSDNEKTELPFTIFSHNVILQFESSKEQTPMSGNLNDSGHEGGTFFFELKKEEKRMEIISDKNDYLQKKLVNLYIPLNDFTQEDIDKINEIKQEKIKVVKEQKFQEAAVLRNKEKLLEEKIFLDSEPYLETLIAIDLPVSPNVIELDLAIEKYLMELESQKELYEKELNEYRQKQKEFNSAEEVSDSIMGGFFDSYQLFSIEEFAPSYSMKNDPAYKYFNENQKLLSENYNSGIIQLYRFFKTIQGESKSSILLEKEKLLKEILSRIYFYEIDILRGRLDNSLDELIHRKEIEINILAWIRNKLI